MKLKELEYEKFILSTRPILWLPLYRKGGSTFLSSDGYGHVCTATGTTWGQQGRTLNGTTDLITVPQTASINNLVTITILSRIYPTGWGGGSYGRILDKAQKIFSVDGFGGVNRLAYNQTFSVAGAGWATANGTLSLNIPYFVGVTYDNSNTANDPLFYINGERKAVTETTTPDGTASADAANDLIIGNNSAVTRSFAGIEREVWYYNRILTSVEILRIYQWIKWRHS